MKKKFTDLELIIILFEDGLYIDTLVSSNEFDGIGDGDDNPDIGINF